MGWVLVLRTPVKVGSRALEHLALKGQVQRTDRAAPLASAATSCPAEPARPATAAVAAVAAAAAPGIPSGVGACGDGGRGGGRCGGERRGHRIEPGGGRGLGAATSTAPVPEAAVDLVEVLLDPPPSIGGCRPLPLGFPLP